MSLFLGTFQKTLSSGSAEQLTTTRILTPSWSIRSAPTNTGNAYLGRQGVTSGTGTLLAVNEMNSKTGRSARNNGEKQWDLSKVYIIGTSGDVFYIEYDTEV